ARPTQDQQSNHHGDRGSDLLRQGPGRQRRQRDGQDSNRHGQLWGSRMKARLSAVLVLAAVALAGCTVHQSEQPGLTGPSGLSHTIRVTALPDSISQDGGSASSITVTAIDPDGKP